MGSGVGGEEAQASRMPQFLIIFAEPSSDLLLTGFPGKENKEKTGDNPVSGSLGSQRVNS